MQPSSRSNVIEWIAASGLAGWAVFAWLPPARVAAVQSSSARTLEITRPIPYFIGQGSPRTGFRVGDPQLARWALEAWQRSAGPGLHFEAATEPTALIRIYWAGPNAGEYGEMQPIRVNGRRGAAVYVRPDLEALDDEIASRAAQDSLLRDSVVYLTCLHELGHALGLDHTNDFRDIMYYFGYGGDIAAYFGRYRSQLHSRADLATVSGLSDSDVARVRSLYPPPRSSSGR